ncbi:helix-turn-helix domain-containing protein [Nocardiopsis potens]|uniref:helix-turn-helix domain-containing protein n=1 Tax=Nocardiopsis potens TaxID=1246458 RepID=UPI00034C806C|nr:helix-turn-helix transcriptional regulator [Nocardiopsis potens]
MSDLSSQTVRHRRVSAELKAMREEAGRTSYEVADAMGWHRTKVHRLERGEWKRLREQDVRALADYYGVDDQKRLEAVVALAKTASAKGWWSRYKDVLGPGSYVSLEAQASHLRFYSGMLVPGLLQTPAYSEAIMRSGRIKDEEEIQRRLQARAERKALIDSQNGPKVQAIVDQAALNKTIGSPITMAEQLLHLGKLVSLEKIEIGLATDRLGAHTALTGQFVLLDFPGDHGDSTVFIDNAHNGIFLEDPEEVEDYTDVFQATWKLCLTGESATEFLVSLSEDFFKQARR